MLLWKPVCIESTVGFIYWSDGIYLKYPVPCLIDFILWNEWRVSSEWTSKYLVSQPVLFKRRCFVSRANWLAGCDGVGRLSVSLIEISAGRISEMSPDGIFYFHPFSKMSAIQKEEEAACQSRFTSELVPARLCSFVLERNRQQGGHKLKQIYIYIYMKQKCISACKCYTHRQKRGAEEWRRVTVGVNGSRGRGGGGGLKKKSRVQTHGQKFPKFSQTKVTLATPNFGIIQTNSERARRPAKVRRC